MKLKPAHIITMAALSSVSGLAVAATSVDLYGTVNIAIEKKGGNSVTQKAQQYQYASAIGVKGKEDLGNGYAAIFKLEAQLNPDVGSGNSGIDGNQFAFDRESWVGLLTPVGALRFGNSTSPMVNMWMGGEFGSAGRGVGEFTGGLVGAGIRGTKPEAGTRWNNGFFYDVALNGFGAGLAVTTKGSQSSVPQEQGFSPVNNEGQSGTKPAYGAYARYKGQINEKSSFKIGAAYQVDNGGSYSGFPAVNSSSNAPAESKRSWALAAGYGYGPVEISVGYARAYIDNSHLAVSPYTPLRTAQSKTLFASIKGQITPKDAVYVSYGNYKRTNNLDAGKYIIYPLNAVGTLAGTQYSIGYEHQLSKRTVVYANARKVNVDKNTCSGTAMAVAAGMCARTTATVDEAMSSEKGYGYDIGISHSF